MALSVEIDRSSGFCGGVIRAIDIAEKFLESPGHNKLFSLGPIVHNESELARLKEKGLDCIDYEVLRSIEDAIGDSLLIRAHGEPPETYALAKRSGFEIKDCTCPVVLQLQRNIRSAYEKVKPRDGQIIIYGKIGHAEVLGLVGQVSGDAIVIEDLDMLRNKIENGSIYLDAPLEVFSQTTKNPLEYEEICSLLAEKANDVTIHDTICSQVKSRHSKLSEFALSHDAIVFVAGKLSSNGKVLCDLCRSVNARTYCVGSVDEVRKEWFQVDDKVGVCGATSTPKWLLEDIAKEIEKFAL